MHVSVVGNPGAPVAFVPDLLTTAGLTDRIGVCPAVAEALAATAG